jgi:peptidyl-prolyl cis-trans isomerase D
MLDLIRQKKESIIIKAVFIIIVLSFVGTMFLVWGKGSDGSGRQLAYAAKVNRQKISLEEFQNTYQRIRNMYQQIYGQSISPEMEKALGLKKAALNSLIDRVLIMKEADKMGITASKDEVSGAIAAMPMFQKEGAFNFDLYQQLLKSNRITAKEFEEGQEQELILRKTRQAIINRVRVSDQEALNLYKKENDTIALEYLSYGPSEVMGEIRPTEAELKEYLRKNQDQFKTAEKAAISYVLIDPSTHASGVTLSEEEIQAFYQKNIDRWQGKDGLLPLAQVRERVRAEALKQKTARQVFELAADTLFKNIKSGDINLIAARLHLKPQQTPLFSATTPPPAVAGETALIRKAFELKQGELGGPVETGRGIYIIKAVQRVPSQVRPLNEIRGEVEQRFKADRAVTLARAKAEQAAGQLVAKKPLPLQSTASFGFSARGDVPSVGNSPELMEAAFRLTTASPAAPAPFKVGDRWYAIRLKSRSEAPRGEFDRTKEAIKQRMLPRKQEEALAAWLKQLRSKAKIEINQALVAEK